MTTTQIIGLIIVCLILYGAWIIRQIEDAPYWDEEHGFYTDEEIENLKKEVKEIYNKLKGK